MTKPFGVTTRIFDTSDPIMSNALSCEYASRRIFACELLVRAHIEFEPGLTLGERNCANRSNIPSDGYLNNEIDDKLTSMSNMHLHPVKPSPRSENRALYEAVQSTLHLRL